MNGVAARISKILIASAFGASATIAQPPALKLGVARTGAQPSVIEVQSVKWAALTSDPQEGGEVVRNGGGHSMLGASDRKSKPTVSEIPVTKLKDVSSSKLSAAPSGGESAEPGKLEIPNLVADAPASVAVNDPPPAGTATITVARGMCTTGQHIPKLKLTMGTRAFELNDVDVGPCADAGGDNQTCTLTYASLGN